MKTTGNLPEVSRDGIMQSLVIMQEFVQFGMDVFTYQLFPKYVALLDYHAVLYLKNISMKTQIFDS